MFKNRFILVLGVLSLLLVTMAVSNPFSNTSPAGREGANDFYQRHPEWTSSLQSAIVPVTGDLELSDYHQRHPELSAAAGITVDMSDYFLRHPALQAPAKSNDLSDYFLRH